METRLDEIGDRIFRISTFVPQVPPIGFTFNQFLVDADEPLLFHCGMRALFPAVKTALERVMPVDRLRWISFGHVEADELGAMNHWLAAAPRAEVLHGEVGCGVSLNDLADRPPRPLADGATIELGGRRIRLLATPNVIHNWESILLFEETTSTLLCGDLFTTLGPAAPLTRDDPSGVTLEQESAFPGAVGLTATLGPTLRRLAALEPKRLAAMHGSSFEGDGGAALRNLADGFEAMVRKALA